MVVQITPEGESDTRGDLICLVEANKQEESKPEGSWLMKVQITPEGESDDTRGELVCLVEANKPGGKQARGEMVDTRAIRGKIL